MDSTTVLIVLGVVVAGLYLWYASIISKRNKALEALSGIDVQLKKRSNLIPNIPTIAKKFIEHESSLLTEVTELRTQSDQNYDPKDVQAVKDHLAKSGKLGSRMGQLMINVENYPDLKSDATMIQAQQTYSEVEAQISGACITAWQSS